jgi:hypothetical protein
MHADDDELETVLHHLWNSHDPTAIANRLMKFWKRPLPLIVARLIGLCQHFDSEVRRWAFRALQLNQPQTSMDVVPSFLASLRIVIAG